MFPFAFAFPFWCPYDGGGGGDDDTQFLQSTMHELVSSAGEIKLTPELQYMPGQDTVRRTFQINFGQVYLAKPTAREKDGCVAFSATYLVSSFVRPVVCFVSFVSIFLFWVCPLFFFLSLSL